MDYFGINSADELPKIREVLAEQMVEPTVLKDTLFGKGVDGERREDDELLSVTEEGQLIINKEDIEGEES